MKFPREAQIRSWKIIRTAATRVRTRRGACNSRIDACNHPLLPPSADEISCLNRGYCELDYFDIDIALQSWLGACNRTRYTESRKLDELERRARRRSPELLTGCNVNTLPSSSIPPLAPSRNIVAPCLLFHDFPG